jgi:hypothetical protein
MLKEEEIKISIQHLFDHEILLSPFIREGNRFDNYRFTISDKKKEIALLAISPESDPSVMEKDFNSSKKAKELLGKKLGSVILDPLHRGEINGRSYVIWPYVKQFSFNHYLEKLLNIIFIRRRVVSWYTKSSLLTKKELTKPELENHYITPLEYVKNNEDLPKEIREYSEYYLDKIKKGHWEPYCVFQHGDLWPGNILYNTLKIKSYHHLIIIDLRGTKEFGYPLNDIIYYYRRLGLPLFFARLLTKSYCRTMRIDRDQIIGYSISSLGELGLNRDQFDYRKYLNICDEMIQYSESLGGKPRDFYSNHLL